MDEQLQDDWLDARLREEAPYLDDAGFTARVLQQLPAARPQASRARLAILLGTTVVACLIALVLAGNFVLSAALFLVAVPLATDLLIAGACGLAVMTVGTTVAVARLRGHRL